MTEKQREIFEHEVSQIALEYLRRTSELNATSTPEEFAQCYDSAFERIADKLLRLEKQKT